MMTDRIFEIYHSNLSTSEKPEIRNDNTFNPIGIKVHQMAVGERTIYILDQYIDGVKSNIMYTIDYKVIENIWTSIFHKGNKKMLDYLCRNKVIIVDYDNKKVSLEATKVNNDYSSYIVNDFKNHIELLQEEYE